MIARFGPPLTILLLAGPVLAGLAGTLLPAFGYLPALGGDTFSFEPFGELAAQSGIWRSAWMSYYTGVAAAAISLLLVMLFVAGPIVPWLENRSGCSRHCRCSPTRLGT